MSQHGPFGPARGSGGVENGRKILATPLDNRHRLLRIVIQRRQRLRQSALPVCAQRPHLRTRRYLCHQVPECLLVGRITDEQSRRGVTEEVGDLGSRVGRVDRHVNRTGPQAAQIEGDAFRRLRRLHQNPVAGPDRQGLQQRGADGTLLLERKISDVLGAFQNQRRAIRLFLERVAEQREKILVHRNLSSGRPASVGRPCRRRHRTRRHFLGRKGLHSLINERHRAGPRDLRLISALTLAFCLLLAGCGDSDPSGTGGPQGFSRGPTYVVTTPAAVREIRDEVEAIGTTRANESVTIAAKLTDTVSRVNFEDGELVNEGEVLIELTNREQSALLDEAEANLQDARNQARRMESMAADNLVPLSELDAANARLAAADARYQSIVARLEDRLIRAPFSGLLGFREVSEGTLVTPGSRITTLDDISVIKLDFSIPEVHLNLVRPGLTLVAESSAFPDRRFRATVRTVGSRVDENTRAATVRAHIDNPDLLLKPGMLLTVHLTTATRQALMVPEAALLQRSSQAFVFTIENGRASMRQIRSGVRRDGWVEVEGGLSEAEAVVTEGVIKIRDGSPVTTEGIANGRPSDGRPGPEHPGGF